VEEWRDGAFRRTLRLPHGHAIAALSPGPDYIACQLSLTDLRDLPVAISRCRRLLDLDADPVAVDDVLGADPVLEPLVAKAPGRRVPRTVDGEEFAIRTVLGQQVSTAAARTHAGRLVGAYGDPISDPGGGLTALFPTTERLATLDPSSLAMPRTRQRTLTGLARTLADGEIDLGAGSDWQRAREQLAALPGLGPWSVETIAMRALGDPDAFLPGDLGVRVAAAALDLPEKAAALSERSAAWAPWRAYAVQYLWAVNDHPINRLPQSGEEPS
jgi:AraC family transcriptional regulator of adaptative response / DNA-3-methyladenine glycosylase II